MFKRISACVFAAAASLAGCMGTGNVEYAGEVHVTSPELVMVSPGVEVVADADEPLFYSDGYYWLYRDDAWLRSDTVQGGFVRVDVSYVPQPIRRIERPQAFAQYRRHHGRNVEARATPEPQRAPYNPGYRRTYPDQGVHSTPPPDTQWEPQERRPPDVLPRPTPPVTTPADIHGTPMPPGHVQMPPGQMKKDDRVPPGQLKKDDRDNDDEQGRAEERRRKNEERARKHDERGNDKKSDR